ncbi:VOC family protein [Gordonia mangrovi]|uniref:VOC family protein n=1 Tax=Gordonia mangrovi TaxID=2665643 RepID=UPI0021AC1F57|nr:VOC family protein [Gordonia mangrovi]MDY6807393.1 VOC family protein [Actinomycetota bacterium]UVF78547.1 VOC family protein [Gordonia mangrovi]
MTATPPLHGLHHLTLTVSDLEASVQWYVRVLGFTEVTRVRADGMHKSLLNRPDLPPISFVAHGDSAVVGAFDEHRVGLDHLSFAVADLAELQLWVSVLDQEGVAHGDVAAGRSGSVVSFRDPDGIALEFYTLV